MAFKFKIRTDLAQLDSQLPDKDLMIISFCIPLLGLVLYLLNRKMMPHKAKVVVYVAGLGCIVRLIMHCCYILSLPTL